MSYSQSNSPKSDSIRKGVLIFTGSLVALVAMGVVLTRVLGGGAEEPVAQSTVNTVVPVVSSSPSDPVDIATEIETVTADSESELTSVEGSGFVSSPESTRVVSYEEAEEAYQARHYEEALDLFTDYTQQRPGNPWGHYMRGLSAWKAGWPEEADVSFRSAIRLDPKHTKSHTNLVRVLLELGRPGEALEFAETATELASDRSETFRLLGRVHHNLGRVDEAVEAYERAVSVSDEDVWALNNLGLLLIERERFTEAMGPLARAVQVKPDEVLFQNNFGIALERSGHYSAAADAFRAVLAVDDTNLKALASLERVDELVPFEEVLGEIDVETLAAAYLERFLAPETDFTVIETMEPVETIEP